MGLIPFHTPLDEHQLEILEAELRSRFPPIYRKWLISTNGGEADGMWMFRIPNCPYAEDGMLRELYGVCPAHPEHDLLSRNQEMLWILRHDHILVGWAEESCLFSLRLGGSDETIYYWDIADPGDDRGLRTPYPLAPDIHRFLDSLEA